MFIRPSPALTSSIAHAARSSLRSQVASARAYATEAGKPTKNGKESNLPLVLGLGGIVGLAYWYKLGGLEDPPKVAEKVEEKAKQVEATVSGGALNKDAFVEFTLKEVKPYNHDTKTFVFDIPDGQKAGMGVASAVVFKSMDGSCKDDKGKDVIRPYTAITSPDTVGHIDFLVKKYENGKMTNFIHNMKPGDKIGIKGPIPKWPYKANEFEQIGMIAGGSGITPMWQVIQEIVSNPQDKTKITLIYTNKTDQDILLRQEFDNLAKKDDRFNVVYGLDKPPSNFNGFTGYLDQNVLGKHMPIASLGDKTKIFVCGPPGQVTFVCGPKGPRGVQGELKGLLADLGYQADQVYKF